MQLRIVLNNRQALELVASYLQHFAISTSPEWLAAAYAKAEFPFVISKIDGIRLDQIEVVPRGWRERWRLICLACSRLRKDDA